MLGPNYRKLNTFGSSDIFLLLRNTIKKTSSIERTYSHNLYCLETAWFVFERELFRYITISSQATIKQTIAKVH